MAAAQPSRVITAEWFSVEKNDPRYGPFGVNRDNDAVFEGQKETTDGWASIVTIVTDGLNSLNVHGPDSGPASVQPRAERDGSDRTIVRGAARSNTVWSVP